MKIATKFDRPYEQGDTSDTMGLTGYVMTTAEKGGERYRWYLCIEKQPAIWTCSQVSQETAITYYSEKGRTKTVPIHYTNPPLLDRLYIRAALQPRIIITNEE